MAKTPLPPRPDSAFVYELDAANADVDALGHVSNVVYVRWVQDAAAAHSASVGWDFDAYDKLGAIFVVRRHQITYLAPVYAGDPVRCSTWVGGLKGASSVRYTVIERVSDGVEVAQAETLWALVSRINGRPTRIPETLRLAFNAAGGILDEDSIP